MIVMFCRRCKVANMYGRMKDKKEEENTEEVNFKN